MKVASLDKVTGPPRSPECGNPDEAWPEVPSPSEPAHVRNDFEDFLEDPGLASATAVVVIPEVLLGCLPGGLLGRFSLRARLQRPPP
jgi:hypothetical protein